MLCYNTLYNYKLYYNTTLLYNIILLYCSLAGVDLQTQEAYELASKGMLRPEYSNTGTQTIIYSVKPVEFSPPELQIGKLVLHSRSIPE